MQHADHCDLLALEVDRFAAAFDDTPADRPVPSCPGWTVGDLAGHLGTIHRWAERLVRVRAAARIPASEMGLDEGPPDGDWLRDGGEALVATLRTADPDAPMWAWGVDQHVRYWSRRQLHETLVHRCDLELAGADQPAIAPAVAADAVDELLHNLAEAVPFSPSLSDLRGDGERLVFRASDSGDAWTVTLEAAGFTVTDGEHPADAGLSGPAARLSLVLYRRLPLAGCGLDVTGPELVEFWLTHSALQ